MWDGYSLSKDRFLLFRREESTRDMDIWDDDRRSDCALRMVIETKDSDGGNGEYGFILEAHLQHLGSDERARHACEYTIY